MAERLVRIINGLNDRVGRALSWLTLVMVAVTFVIVILRYFFNMGWVWMQEIVTYSHAVIFLGAAAYTLLRDAHVRVDILYRGAAARRKAWVNLTGTLLFLFPLCYLVFRESGPYVLDSWAVREGSTDGGGLEAVYLLKTFLLVFAGLLALQGVSAVISNGLFLAGRAEAPAGGTDPETERDLV